MSGYLLSLVQRARGEGAALQPRVRGRFEPGGFEEISTEVAAAAPAPAATTRHVAPAVILPDEHQIPTPILTTETNVGRASARPDGLKPVLHDVDGEPSRLIEHIEREERVVEERVTAAPPSAPEVRVEIERAAPHASAAGVPPPQSPLRVHTTRTIAHQAEHEREEDPAIHITIGRIDVRAVAPPALSRPAPAPKRNAPLTLEDYLRRRDGEKR